MITTEQIHTLLDGGGTVIDASGSKIGKIRQIFLDDQTGKPEWVTAKSGMFGAAETFIPLAHGTVEGSDIHVPYGKDKVKDAPRLDDSESRLSQDREAELYRYYGLNYSETVSDSGLPAGGAPGGGKPETAIGRDKSGLTYDAMTRSEEQLHVGTEKRVSGKARLRKFVVTENVTQTVPVSHEEVHIEREPITEQNRDAATAGPDISDEEHEVTLTEERLVVAKETVPVERVRMDKETITENQQVNEKVRKEQIEADTSEVPKGSSGTGRTR
ncbi:MAG: PRC and DUF2382 domain-containing protein [Nitrococcus sp.]|nr:PRC and DUF2382 domain-containing protein [Nitrococcus sp.]